MKRANYTGRKLGYMESIDPKEEPYILLEGLEQVDSLQYHSRSYGTNWLIKKNDFNQLRMKIFGMTYTAYGHSY